MAARSISAGTISFGLVSIPVKLFSAAESSSSIRFNMLSGETKSRLKQQYIDPTNGEIVTRDKMVKGYEFSKGQFVTFDSEEMKALQEESNRAIEITEFVPMSKVDPVFFDGAYYLGPDKGGDKAYLLLRKAMQKTDRAALAKWAARGKQYLVMLRATPRGLIMQQLHYADEIKSFDEVPVGDAELKDGELDLAVKLVEQIATDTFHPENYEDEVRKRMHAAIQRKVEGEAIVAAPETPKAQVIDLMEALKASLAGPAASTKAAANDAGPAEADEQKKSATG
jgi:DNA end-binding protein Ku